MTIDQKRQEGTELSVKVITRDDGSQEVYVSLPPGYSVKAQDILQLIFKPKSSRIHGGVLG